MTIRADLEFVVLGKPQPGGSKQPRKNKRTGSLYVTDANPEALPWKQQVAGAAQIAMAGRPPFIGPVRLELTFIRARKTGHYGTGKNSDKLKPSAPAYPTTAPDATKLCRATEDAMHSIVWRNDAQVVWQVVRKLYGTPERVCVRVWGLADDAIVLDEMIPGVEG